TGTCWTTCWRRRRPIRFVAPWRRWRRRAQPQRRNQGRRRLLSISRNTTPAARAPPPTTVRNGVEKVSTRTVAPVWRSTLIDSSRVVRPYQRSPIAPVPKATTPMTKEAMAATFIAASRWALDRTAADHANQQDDDGDNEQNVQDTAQRVLRNHSQQ